jgi:TBC1 domain family member 2
MDGAEPDGPAPPSWSASLTAAATGLASLVTGRRGGLPGPLRGLVGGAGGGESDAGGAPDADGAGAPPPPPPLPADEEDGGPPSTSPSPPSPPPPPPPPPRSASGPRIAKFRALLDAPTVDTDALRELAWSGVPPHLRPDVWRLLLGYLPAPAAARPAVLARKRREYAALVPAHHAPALAAAAAAAGGGGGEEDASTAAATAAAASAGPGAAAAAAAAAAGALLSGEEAAALRQVLVDVPRTAPGHALLARPPARGALTRILHLWGVRHPASGYVQGMNDVATPLLAAFLAGEASGSSGNAFLPPDDPAWAAAPLPAPAAAAAEADAYWCLGRLLEGMQDHYTHAQPGIQRAVARLGGLVSRVDRELAGHLSSVGADFMHFAFRWVNCLLLREVPPLAAARLFDTWCAEGTGRGGGARLADFLVYACAAFLLAWREPLLGCAEFGDVALFLQRPPTADWGEAEVEGHILARAFQLRASFGGARAHWGDGGGGGSGGRNSGGGGFR